MFMFIKIKNNPLIQLKTKKKNALSLSLRINKKKVDIIKLENCKSIMHRGEGLFAPPSTKNISMKKNTNNKIGPSH